MAGVRQREFMAVDVGKAAEHGGDVVTPTHVEHARKDIENGRRRMPLAHEATDAKWALLTHPWVEITQLSAPATAGSNGRGRVMRAR